MTAAAESSIISIHVPREGHDLTAEFEAKRRAISIHVPREGHDAKTDRTFFAKY